MTMYYVKNVKIQINITHIIIDNLTLLGTKTFNIVRLSNYLITCIILRSVLQYLNNILTTWDFTLEI